MANNADSLILLDIANDIWMGKSLYGWNFPRVLYIFPDLVIALIVMAPGWFGDWTLFIIASINYSLLTLIVHRLIQGLHWNQSPSILGTALLLLLSIALFAALFPFSTSNIFWQIFANGAHFLSVILVVYVFTLIPKVRLTPISIKQLGWILLLIFLASLSNTMSALLISVMIFLRWFWDQYDQFHNPKKIRLVTSLEFGAFLAVVGGVALGGQIPRQSMANSFFSKERFAYSLDIFNQWLSSSWLNGVFLVFLLLLVTFWAILSTPYIRKKFFSFPVKIQDWMLVLRNPYLLPAITIFLAAPLFYQEITRSLRYFAFPALLSLTVICVVIWQFQQYLSKYNSYIRPFSIAAIAAICAVLITVNPDKTYVSDDALPISWIKQANLADRTHPKLAIDCIKELKIENQLEDGIALYWSARPARFYSNFEFHFSQVMPWNPRGGYALWGANAMNTLYSDNNWKTKRNYNFILASDSDLAWNFWGSILSKSNKKFSCGNFHIFFYDDPSVLSSFLFPWGVPDQIDGNGNESILQQKTDLNNLKSSINFLQFPAEDLKTVIGDIDKNKIFATGKDGFLVFGPYINLPIGRYELIAFGTLMNKDQTIGVIDIVGNGGMTISKELIKPMVIKNSPQNGFDSNKYLSESFSLHSPEIVRLEFIVQSPIREAEFRIQVPKSTTGFFESYILIRKPL